MAIAAHPDDVELAASGTLLAAIAAGHTVALVDLSRGELGTRGTPEIRAQEAAEATKFMGIRFRENVGLPDGFISNTREQQMALIPYIRKYRPRIVLANAVSDRHTDHGKAGALVSDACFLSGLKAITTADDRGETQTVWRPQAVYHYIQDRYIKPDLVVDITPWFEKKMELIALYKSQFYTGAAQHPEETTPISTPEFWKFLEARSREMGRTIGVEFGEGFTTERPAGVSNLLNLK